MGQEIERARGLLGALTRGKVLPAEEAAKAYEEWVAGAGDKPFSRHLIDLGVPAETIRSALRLLAVQGLPHPERYTLERFEDLLVGQLGIEAGMLSPKLLRSVRAVQDKKVGEGKLRRLSQLLPRTGFDESMLALLHQHLQERILLCKGCLGRYPRRDLSDVAEECPRCGAGLRAAGMEPSAVLDLLPENQRKALIASSEHVLASPNPEDVSERERPTGSRPLAKEPGNPMVPVVIVLTLVVIGGIVGVVLLEGGENHGVPVSQRPEPRDQTPDPDPATDPARGGDAAEVVAGSNSVASARQIDARLLAEGRYADMLQVWRKVTPAEGEDPAEVARTKERRIGELERMVALAEAAGQAVKRIEAGAVPAEVEREMTRVLRRSPPNRPGVFRDLQLALAKQKKRREEGAGARAAKRYQNAIKAVTPEQAAWDRRSATASRARPLLGVELGGRAVDGVRIGPLSQAGYRLLTPDGAKRELTWEERPHLALRVFSSVAEASERFDQFELLRLALLARNPTVAESALRALALGGAAPNVDRVLAEAPTPAYVFRQEGESARLAYPLGWRAHGVEPVGATKLKPGPQGLLLEGAPCGIETGRLPVRSGKPSEMRIAVGGRVSGAARWPSLTLSLHGKSSRREYTARWSADQWVLEVNFGSAATKLASGPLGGGGASRDARLELRDGEVLFSLGNLPLVRRAVTARCQGVSLRVSADGGPLTVEGLWVEGHVDGEALATGERAYQAVVRKVLEAIHASPTGAGETWPALSVEDPQEQAFASEEVLGAVEEAKAHLRAGRLDSASTQLEDLQTEAPNLLSIPYYRAYLAALSGEVAAGRVHVDLALSKRAGFPEGRALRGLLQTQGARFPPLKPGEQLAKKRPDLPAIYLARAWASYRGREIGAVSPERSAVEDPLAVASSLAPGDPLVQRHGRVLRAACDLEATFKARHGSAMHVVMTRTTEADAEIAVKRLDALTKKLRQKVGRSKKPLLPVPVMILPRGELTALVGKETGAAYDPELHLLLLDGVPSGKPTESLVRAAAYACLHARYGTLPPWLEVGLAEHLTDTQIKGPPVDLAKIVQTDGRWSQERWDELLGLDRRTLITNTLARARCWALLRTLGARSFSKQLQQAVGGQRWTLPELRVAKLEDSVSTLR